MENPPVNASPPIPEAGVGAGEGGYDYSAILFIVMIPILLIFIIKYIIELNRPTPTDEPFFGEIEDAFKKIGDLDNLIKDEVNKIFKVIEDTANSIWNQFMEFIDDMWRQIKDLFAEVWRKITSIVDELACPFRILRNFGLCLGNYGGDVLLYILYALVYAITFIIYCFFYSICYGICFFTNQLCIKFDPSQLCPTRHNIGQTIDFISIKGNYRFFDTFQLTTGKTFFYRDGYNMNECYCSRPIQEAFDPVTKRGLDSIVPNVNTNSRAPLIIALCLTALLFSKRFIR